MQVSEERLSDGRTMAPKQLTQAQNNINYGLGMTAFSLVGTIVGVLFHLNHLNYWSLVDVAILAVALWRIATKDSVVWICIAAADFILSKGLQLQRGSVSTSALCFSALFMYFYARGVYGAFQYRHAMRPLKGQKDLFPGDWTS